MSDEATEHVAHFTIDGGYLTQLIQRLMLEDSPGKAWRVAENVRGGDADVTAATTIKLIKGTHRLKGDSSKGLQLVEQGPRAVRRFQKKLDYIYAGRIQIGVLWFRPVAWIDGYGREDMKNDHNKPVYQQRFGGAWGYVNRGWHYVAHDETLLVARAPKKSPWLKGREREDDFVFEPCGERPHWMRPCADATVALEEWWAAGRRLDHRGWIAWYAGDAPASNVLVQDAEDLDDAEQDARAAEADRVRQIRYDHLRNKILEQAGDDLIDFRHGSADLRIPRAPFVHWALDRTGAKHLAPPWRVISPSGMKLQLDDPFHTDWMIGAGLTLDYDDRELHDALLEFRFETARTFTDAECGLLVGGPYACAKAVHPTIGETVPLGSIVVLPDLRPQWLSSLIGAAAVVAEKGGAGAHLAQIGRERHLPIVIVRDARTRYPAGTTISVDSETPCVRIHETRREEKSDDNEE